MIYFDNTATGGFKPNAVIDAVTTSIRYLCANPGRSGHRLSLTGAKAVYDCRAELAELFNCTPEKVIFTKNCTEALNIAIFGTAVRGGKVITTTFEHNSVLRPLIHLQKIGIITLEIVCPSKNKTIEQAIEEKITDNTYMIACTATSNVTGEQMPLYNIGNIAKAHNLLFLVDGAQGAGHMTINMKELNINMLSIAGHKGLYGIMGSGALLIDQATNVSPFIHGGTGSESFNLYQPDCYPERLEAGTINLPAVMGLLEGVRFIKPNVQSFSKHLVSATERLINGLKNIEGITLYSKPNGAGIVSFSLVGISSQDLADILNKEYDIAVRGGLHCAPLTHKYLHTEKEGLLRVGLAVQNSFREIDYFIKVINKIAIN